MDLASDFELGRSRIISFRVSTGEFESMMRASRSSGSRSLSAFARAAVIEQVRSMQFPAVTLSGDLATLSRTLADIEQALQDASRQIRRILGSGDPPRLDTSRVGN